MELADVTRQCTELLYWQPPSKRTHRPTQLTTLRHGNHNFVTVYISRKSYSMCELKNIVIGHWLPQAVNCIRFCFWRCLWHFVCVWNISGTAERICAKFTGKTCLIPRSEEFECQGQRSKVKVTRDKKRHFSALSAACVQFVFGKIFSPSSSGYFWIAATSDMQQRTYNQSI